MAEDEKKRVKDWFKNLEYAELLLAVKPKMTSEKQLEFFTKMVEGFDLFGGSAYLSEKQKEWLVKARG